MNINGTFSSISAPYISSFTTQVDSRGILQSIDSVYVSNLSGYISDSTFMCADQTYVEGSYLSTDDLTLKLAKWNYKIGAESDSTDGTYVQLYPVQFDPLWVNFSIWGFDGTEYYETEYRYREPVRMGVGLYYAPITVPAPSTPSNDGSFEIRWRFLKDPVSIVHEVIRPFMSASVYDIPHNLGQDYGDRRFEYRDHRFDFKHHEHEHIFNSNSFIFDDYIFYNEPSGV